jgi:hypothetical protein
MDVYMDAFVDYLLTWKNLVPLSIPLVMLLLSAGCIYLTNRVEQWCRRRNNLKYLYRSLSDLITSDTAAQGALQDKPDVMTCFRIVNRVRDLQHELKESQHANQELRDRLQEQESRHAEKLFSCESMLSSSVTVVNTLRGEIEKLQQVNQCLQDSLQEQDSAIEKHREHEIAWAKEVGKAVNAELLAKRELEDEKKLYSRTLAAQRNDSDGYVKTAEELRKNCTLLHEAVQEITGSNASSSGLLVYTSDAAVSVLRQYGEGYNKLKELVVLLVGSDGQGNDTEDLCTRLQQFREGNLVAMKELLSLREELRKIRTTMFISSCGMNLEKPVASFSLSELLVRRVAAERARAARNERQQIQSSLLVRIRRIAQDRGLCMQSFLPQDLEQEGRLDALLTELFTRCQILHQVDTQLCKLCSDQDEAAEPTLSKLENLVKRCTQQQSLLDSQVLEIQQLNGYLQGLRQQLGEALPLTETQRADLLATQRRLDEIKQQRDKLSAILAAKVDERGQLQEKIRQLQLAVKTSESQALEARDHRDALLSRRDEDEKSYRKELQVLHNWLATRVREIDYLKACVSDRESENATLRAKLYSSQQLSEYQQRHKELAASALDYVFTGLHDLYAQETGDAPAEANPFSCSDEALEDNSASRLTLRTGLTRLVAELNELRRRSTEPSVPLQQFQQMEEALNKNAERMKQLAGTLDSQIASKEQLRKSKDLATRLLDRVAARLALLRACLPVSGIVNAPCFSRDDAALLEDSQNVHTLLGYLDRLAATLDSDHNNHQKNLTEIHELKGRLQNYKDVNATLLTFRDRLEDIENEFRKYGLLGENPALPTLVVDGKDPIVEAVIVCVNNHLRYQRVLAALPALAGSEQAFVDIIALKAIVARLTTKKESNKA